jgi:hypothetical protein
MQKLQYSKAPIRHPHPKIQSQLVMAQVKKNNFEETEVEDNVGFFSESAPIKLTFAKEP